MKPTFFHWCFHTATLCLIVFTIKHVEFTSKNFQIDLRSDISVPITRYSNKKQATKTGKPFIYLITGKQWTDSYKLKPNNDRDVVFLNFGEPSTLNNTDDLTVIFRPKTTWTEARNILLEYAIDRQMEHAKTETNFKLLRVLRVS